MKRLIFMAVIAIVSMTSFRAAAQPPTQAFGVYFTGLLGKPDYFGCEISTLNIGISTSQPPALFQPAYTWTQSGSFTQPWGLFTFGGYWVTPSLATPLTISINPGYTASVRNIRASGSNSTTVRIGVIVGNPNGSGNNTVVYGPYVKIDPQETKTLQVPTVSSTYTTATLPNVASDPTYKIPLGIILSN